MVFDATKSDQLAAHLDTFSDNRAMDSLLKLSLIRSFHLDTGQRLIVEVYDCNAALKNMWSKTEKEERD
ncbi:MAG TPA: hypothetical protein VH591_11315 [Ktedonobacterales bacterium]